MDGGGRSPCGESLDLGSESVGPCVRVCSTLREPSEPRSRTVGPCVASSSSLLSSSLSSPEFSAESLEAVPSAESQRSR
jgi:hypothetical protein